MARGRDWSPTCNWWIRAVFPVSLQPSWTQVVIAGCVLWGLAGFSVSFLWAQEGVLIQAIEIRGNQHISTSAIEGQLTIRPGDVFREEQLREQIQRIYRMGFFEDVQAQTEPVAHGVRVVFVVRENPFLTEVRFDGNDHFSDDKLRELLTLRTQVFLDEEQVKVSAERIRKAYQEDGYYHVEVIPVIEELGENRKRLTFFIREGTRARIREVRFEGRTAVEKDDLLEVMATREYVPIWSWITDAGLLNKEEIPNDVERIKEVYMNKGYLDVQVGMPRIELDAEQKWYTVTFPIVEGEPYTVSRVRFEGNTVFTDEELQKELRIHPGDVFQRATVREEVARLTDLYGERGYAFAEITPSILPDAATRTTEIVFHIDEGELVRVREIRITGNNKTRDNVIRRELRIEEQSVIDSRAMKRSFERLNNLNFFETVEIVPKPVDKHLVDLEVKVKEKPTGSFSIGGGFSTLDQFTAIANITEGNLFGMGYLVRIRGQVGVRRTLGVATFRNPAVFDTLTSLQLDAFSTRTNFRTYFEDRAGANVSLGRAFSEFISGTVTLVAEQIRIKNPSSDAPQFILNQLGTQSTTGFRAALFRDSRDYFLDPRRGSRVGIRTGFGTEALGGTNNFFSVSLDGLKYVPLPMWDLRYSIRGRFGYGDGYSGDAFPLSELFFVGGINTVRGFQFGRAGPVTSGGTPAGGNKQLIFNNDLIFPVLPDAKLNGVLFFDYGKGFARGEELDLDLRPAVGLEVRWISPFGPLRAAYGINLDRRPNEQQGVFEFSVGSIF
ncbi:MAG: outer membrane protein assembly factor BamA [Nitrospirae bacterium]|nr:MAG: outer membrane protein assembly factor BamA [Nitrospirota bacterium]